MVGPHTPILRDGRFESTESITRSGNAFKRWPTTLAVSPVIVRECRERG